MKLDSRDITDAFNSDILGCFNFCVYLGVLSEIIRILKTSFLVYTCIFTFLWRQK